MPIIRTRPLTRSAVALGATALFGLAACSSAGTGTEGGDPPSNAPSGAAATSAAPSSAAPSSAAPGSAAPTSAGAANQRMLKAGATAEDKATSGQKLTSIESEDANSRWEITLTDDDGTEYDVDVSADGSTAQRGPTKQNDSAADLREQRRELAAAKIDYREAAAAVTKAQSGRITELNLDTERGTVVWEANLVDSSNAERAIKINAENGKLISNVVDD